MVTDTKYYQEIIGKLEKVCQKKYLNNILIGFHIVLLTAILFFTIFSFFELSANLNSSIRTFLVYFALIVAGGSAVYFLVIPLLRYFKLFRAAFLKCF